MSFSKKFRLVVLAVTLLSGCGKKSDSPKVDEGFLFSHVPTIENSQNYDNEKVRVLEQMRGSRSIPTSVVINILLSDHLANASERGVMRLSHDTMRAKVSEIAAGVSFSPITESKVGLEKRFSTSLGKLIYNSTAVSVGDIFQTSKMQCYSGTVLFFLVATQTLGANGIESHNLVAIFESGHVLPGVVVETPNGKALMGLEMTAGGKAVVEYGLLKDLSTQVRVVEGKNFLLSEIFKFRLSRPVEFSNRLLRSAAERFGIGKVFEVENSLVIPAATKTNLNWSPFGFGQSNAPAGDIERSSFDVKSRSEFGTGVPSPTISGFGIQLPPGFDPNRPKNDPHAPYSYGPGYPYQTENPY